MKSTCGKSTGRISVNLGVGYLSEALFLIIVATEKKKKTYLRQVLACRTYEIAVSELCSMIHAWYISVLSINLSQTSAYRLLYSQSILIKVWSLGCLQTEFRTCCCHITTLRYGYYFKHMLIIIKVSSGKYVFVAAINRWKIWKWNIKNKYRKTQMRHLVWDTKKRI